jgi:hypothetical protein
MNSEYKLCFTVYVRNHNRKNDGTEPISSGTSVVKSKIKVLEDFKLFGICTVVTPVQIYAI